LPYLDGPALEWLELPEKKIRFLWLIRIAPAEAEFRKRHGLKELEARMEAMNFDYLDPKRQSVV